MAWAAIEAFRCWVGKRKELLTGLLGVAIETTVESIPGAGLTIKILGEFAKHGVERLAKPEAVVPGLKEAGQVIPAEQLDQLNAWLEMLTVSYAGLVEKLDGLTSLTGEESLADLTAVVKKALLEREDLAQEFQTHERQVRQLTLSLSRVEEKIDQACHGINGVGLALEDIKVMLAEAPGLTEWQQFRQARPDAIAAINQADAHFLAGRRDQGVAVLLDLARRRGAGTQTLCHRLGLHFLGQGQTEQARRYLDQCGEGGRPSPALTRTLTNLGTTSRRGDRLPVWRSLPRGFIVEQRYRVDSEVGRGGMASVYKVIGIDDINGDQVFALKVPAPELMADAATRQRFLQEIKVSQRLSAVPHAGIVQTHNYVMFDDPHTRRKLYGLVLEYIDGLNLAHYLAQRQARQKPLTPAEILQVLKQVCQALIVAHAQNPVVLHRDIKPHNIMLTRSGVAKVMDFGIARVLDESRATLAGQSQVVGSPLYMPPEFLDPRAVLDARCDVFLAGNLLLELLTFHPMGDPESRTDCPAGWVRLIADSMSRVKSQRPKTIQEFLERLLEAVTPPTERPKTPEPTKLITNSLGMKLTWIPPGTFRMGSPKTEADRGTDEDQHEVKITHPFYMGVYAVTQQEYERVMGTNPSWFCQTGGGKDKVANLDTKRFPVENVSWEDAQEFCRKLSELPEEKRAGRVYRLPTEAEWEYSCRGGASSYSVFHFGDSLSTTQANFDGNYPYGGAAKGPYLERPKVVGNHQPNQFGLHDMHGNVWEWCNDWYGADYYSYSPKEDPTGPENGDRRVLRGGSWYIYGLYCRAANRFRNEPGYRNGNIGFRVVCAAGVRTP